jgi:hypothetical protein
MEMANDRFVIDRTDPSGSRSATEEYINDKIR